MKAIALFILVLTITACTGVPEGVAPVKGFEIKRYLGTWYEIARFDHSFERGLSNVTATYTLRQDDGVDVLNRGFNNQTNEWEEAHGKAYFVDSDSIGHLKVSFFGPFYASYVVAELDRVGYQYALVTGPDKSYLWILSRQPNLPDVIRNKLVEKAQLLGFDTQQFIWVEQ